MKGLGLNIDSDVSCLQCPVSHLTEQMYHGIATLMRLLPKCSKQLYNVHHVQKSYYGVVDMVECGTAQQGTAWRAMIQHDLV